MRMIYLMTIMLYVIVAFGVAHNIWAWANVIWSMRWLKVERLRVFTSEGASQEIVLMIPMFREKSVAAETLSHFSNFDYPSNRLHIIIVTTNREKVCDAETTGELVERLIDAIGPGNVLHFSADGHDRCKADQLNQALAWLDSKGPSWWRDDSIVGVYDADSRPERDTLAEVAHKASMNPDVVAFQQGALYLSGFDKIRGKSSALLLRSRYLYNIRFFLYRELPGYYRSVLALRSESPVFRFLARSPNHFLGHGEFVRLKTLRSIGGFPAPSADTSLGTVLSFKGSAIMPLSRFDVGESPGSMRMLIFQGSTWYSGCALYLRDMRSAREGVPSHRVRDVYLSAKRWLENMIWAVGPILWSFAAAVSIYKSDLVLVAMCVSVFVLHGLSIYSIIKMFLVTESAKKIVKDLRSIANIEYFFQLICYPLMLGISCLGPILYYALKTRRLFLGGEVPRWKTTRLHD